MGESHGHSIGDRGDAEISNTGPTRRRYEDIRLGVRSAKVHSGIRNAILLSNLRGLRFARASSGALGLRPKSNKMINQDFPGQNMYLQAKDGLRWMGFHLLEIS